MQLWAAFLIDLVDPFVYEGSALVQFSFLQEAQGEVESWCSCNAREHMDDELLLCHVVESRVLNHLLLECPDEQEE